MIREHVVPVMRTSRYINIWDAGCAMGPEPYSLAIILRENMGNMIFRNVRIFATDIDESGNFGQLIAAGSYPEEQVQRIPGEIRERYFVPDTNPGFFRISEEIRNSVSYQKHDLLSLNPVRDGLSLVLCKNVLLHFKEEERVAVIRMFHAALAAGGFLAMEQTQELPAGVAGMFRRVVSNAQLFQKTGLPE
jgi:chemotaxis protein methyltransferase CheR